ncbi:glycoside hydrolase family 9 protein [Sphaerisporangium sp. TRM90804]|uniref:glycoside hydrolase family 9 protein n=1 Tax=Sphaerisporangium sp. TRM90804 TaxID=3031113 RepID=UPI002447B1A0|nr:glycoside hydrolase family 9 protein [Sphaerisporangium sp. TRM90804]MDH2429469.1 glycoside hydrolase family 9 protein [Sphaerisporangium sp. TRM90804]
MRRTLAALSVLALLASGSPAAAESVSGHVRVDQVGFTPSEPKQAYLMTTGPAAGTPFAVVDRQGREVLRGRAGADLGAWSPSYPHVYAIDVSRVRAPGDYRVRTALATSQPFTVAPARQFAAPAANIVTFFGSQRDGADVVPGALRRRPSHLNDRAAAVYEWPTFTGPDTDQLAGDLTRIGGKVDVEGGWFDAGDYLKFTHIIAYAQTLLLASRRDGGPAADPRLRAEAAHGLKWLDKMWDDTSKTLYIQVGIGAGDAAGTFAGDHDVWRLPEADDHSTGEENRYIRRRPVFRAAPPGHLISPNLAGRTAAAFALAAEVEPDRDEARRLLGKAASVYAQARTEDVGRLVTSLPWAFYPESVWRDDMELGGAELALAAQRLGDPRAGQWLRQAAHWAAQYLRHDAGGDTLNLYDVSALGHADLVRALRSGGAGRLAVDEAALLGDLKAQLRIGAERAAADPFRAGAVYDGFDAVPHAFGLAATSRLYRSVSGDRAFDAFGTQQRNWTFGANAWGVSFVVGAGENFERCPHHQIANLNGRLDGRPPVATGAVVNGPNSEDLFADGLGDHMDGMRPCPADGVDRYEPFTGRGSRYVDDVRSWQASEPADDFAAIALYALTLMSND